MKKQQAMLALFLALALICCAACAAGQPETEPDTTASETTIPETTTPETTTPETQATTIEPELTTVLEPEDYCSGELDFSGIPILYREESGQLYRLAWDLENSTTTALESIGQIDFPEKGGFHFAWTGGNILMGNPLTLQTQEAFAYIPVKNLFAHYGMGYKLNYEQKLHFFTDDGQIMTIDLPVVPNSIYNSAKLSSQPNFATIFDDQVLVVQITEPTNDQGAYIDSDLVYCTFPLNDPSAAEWKVAHSPVNTVRERSGGAYIDGKVYLSGHKDIMVLDIETGEVTALGLADQFEALPEDPACYSHIGLLGSYNDTLIVCFTWADRSMVYRYYYIAIQDGQIIGILSRTDTDATWSVYGADLNSANASNLSIHGVLALALNG